MMTELPDRRLRILMVWEAVMATDTDPPNSRVLARASDPRVSQYWDKEGALAKVWQPVLMKNASAVTGKAELITGDVLWDMAALFVRGSRWESKLPAASFVGAPVVQTIAPLAQAIRSALR